MKLIKSIEINKHEAMLLSEACYYARRYWYFESKGKEGVVFEHCNERKISYTKCYDRLGKLSDGNGGVVDELAFVINLMEDACKISESIVSRKYFDELKRFAEAMEIANEIYKVI